MKWQKRPQGQQPARLVRASKVSAEAPGVKVGLYGDSGTGKTAVGSKGEGVLILLSEPNGLPTVRVWNEDAFVVVVTTADDLHTWISSLLGAESGVDDEGAFLLVDDEKVRRVVLDSATEIQRILVDEILSGERRESLTLQEWGLLNDRTIDLIRTVRNLPIDVCVIFLSEAADGGDQRYVRPLMKGRKLPNELAQFFSAFGYCYRTNEDESVNYRVLFGGSDHYITKQATGLGRIEDPDFSAWAKKMREATPESTTTDATDDNQETPAPETRRRRRSGRRTGGQAA